jgi:hypothetical protein
MASVSPEFDSYFDLGAAGPALRMAGFYDWSDEHRPLIRYDLDAMLTEPEFRTQVQVLRDVQADFLAWHNAYLQLARDICRRMGEHYDRPCERGSTEPGSEGRR